MQKLVSTGVVLGQYQRGDILVTFHHVPINEERLQNCKQIFALTCPVKPRMMQIFRVCVRVQNHHHGCPITRLFFALFYCCLVFISPEKYTVLQALIILVTPVTM